MDAVIKNLLEHSSPTPSKWRERAKFRQENKEWLNVSQNIAIQMHQKMREENISQKVLAERLDCSQQYVSKILKGCENLSLETIIRIEKALNIELLPKMAMAV